MRVPLHRNSAHRHQTVLVRRGMIPCRPEDVDIASLVGPISVGGRLQTQLHGREPVHVLVDENVPRVVLLSPGAPAPVVEADVEHPQGRRGVPFSSRSCQELRPHVAPPRVCVRNVEDGDARGRRPMPMADRVLRTTAGQHIRGLHELLVVGDGETHGHAVVGQRAHDVHRHVFVGAAINLPVRIGGPTEPDCLMRFPLGWELVGPLLRRHRRCGCNQGRQSHQPCGHNTSHLRHTGRSPNPLVHDEAGKT
mmetsp:Transcript_69030/g.205416  ORF Transcript_69030/g.205416 Transcript_69030/m.205416 type:complete len:251 (+) Transcript_69030:820-1572(+)